MTEQEIARLGPAFVAYLGRYRECFLQKRATAHFDNYCRGLLTDLPRKTVEPIALEAGTAVRTLQEFLVTARWDHERMRDLLQRHLVQTVAEAPADTLGTVLVRHLIMVLVVLGFVATQTKRLRGEKSAGDVGAGVPCVKPALRGDASSSAWCPRSAACKRSHLLSPTTQRPGDESPQETAA